MCFSKDTFGLFGLHKQVEWSHFEPVEQFWPLSRPKGPLKWANLEPQMAQKRFPKNDPSPVVVPKRMNIAQSWLGLGVGLGVG